MPPTSVLTICARLQCTPTSTHTGTLLLRLTTIQKFVAPDIIGMRLAFPTTPTPECLRLLRNFPPIDRGRCYLSGVCRPPTSAYLFDNRGPTLFDQLRYFFPRERTKMMPKVNLIVAACENQGIGFKGELPWRLKRELAYFARMTKSTRDASKKNAVLMGRRTWESIPPKMRPLAGRINIVLSSTLSKADVGEDVIIHRDFDSALSSLGSFPLSDKCETLWVIGGHSLYKAAMASEHCHRIYLTRILKKFECDTFLPPLDFSRFSCVEDPTIPQGMQEENGIKYEYSVYQNNIVPFDVRDVNKKS